MITLETRVASHYSVDRMLESIREALRASGVDPDAPTPEDLKPVDEFHTGGLEATDALLEQLRITPQTRVVDIGCGIGGTARHVAARSGAHVRGVDLTPDFVTAAARISGMVGLAAQTSFREGSALDLPLAADSADLALMFHVGMNIRDKTRLFAEAARILVPGGQFALFDIMRLSDRALTYPFPWAEEDSLSFLDSPETYRAAARQAGFEIEAQRERRDFAIGFFERVFERMEQAGGPPPLGIHLLMRDTAPQKIRNYVTHLRAGDIAPVEMILRRPG